MRQTGWKLLWAEPRPILRYPQHSDRQRRGLRSRSKRKRGEQTIGTEEGGWGRGGGQRQLGTEEQAEPRPEGLWGSLPASYPPYPPVGPLPPPPHHLSSVCTQADEGTAQSTISASERQVSVLLLFPKPLVVSSSLRGRFLPLRLAAHIACVSRQGCLHPASTGRHPDR